MTKIKTNVYEYLDSVENLVYIKVSADKIDFCLAFNAGSASIFSYEQDPYYTPHQNVEVAIEEYEHKFNCLHV